MHTVTKYGDINESRVSSAGTMILSKKHRYLSFSSWNPMQARKGNGLEREKERRKVALEKTMTGRNCYKGAMRMKVLKRSGWQQKQQLLARTAMKGEAPAKVKTMAQVG